MAFWRGETRDAPHFPSGIGRQSQYLKGDLKNATDKKQLTSFNFITALTNHEQRTEAEEEKKRGKTRKCRHRYLNDAKRSARSDLMSNEKHFLNQLPDI